MEFYARPGKNADKSQNLMLWECGIPGKKDTSWEGGLFKVELHFNDDYPSKPPTIKFTPPLFHPNVYPGGQVCLDIINEGGGWVPAVTIKQMLLGLQELLDEPFTGDPANGPANYMCTQQPAQYQEKIKEMVRANPAAV
jgi:ubiquitin-conjugating enzyme E2 I